MPRKWTKEQRRKFMATLKRQQATVGWGRARRAKKPYRKPRVMVERHGNEVVIRISVS